MEAKQYNPKFRGTVFREGNGGGKAKKDEWEWYDVQAEYTVAEIAIEIIHIQATADVNFLTMGAERSAGSCTIGANMLPIEWAKTQAQEVNSFFSTNNWVDLLLTLLEGLWNFGRMASHLLQPLAAVATALDQADEIYTITTTLIEKDIVITYRVVGDNSPNQTVTISKFSCAAGYVKLEPPILRAVLRSNGATEQGEEAIEQLVRNTSKTIVEWATNLQNKVAENKFKVVREALEKKHNDKKYNKAKIYYKK